MIDPPILDSEKIERILAKFDAFCKTVVRNKYRDMEKAKSRRSKHEVSLETYLKQLQTNDQYPSDEHQIKAGQVSCTVQCGLVYNALYSLSEDRREALLLKYWEKWSDEQIANHFGLRERTIRKWRKESLEQVKLQIKKEYRNGNHL